MPEHSPGRATRARLLVIGASVCWGTTGTAQALGPDDASAIAFGATRNVVGAIVLLAIALARGRLFAGARAIERRPLLLAALTAAAFQLSFFGGVRLAGVAIGTVVGIGSGPIWGGALGWLVRGERPGPTMGRGDRPGAHGRGPAGHDRTAAAIPSTSAAWCSRSGAGLGYATFAVSSKSLTERHDPDLVMTWVFTLSATLLLPLGLIAGVGPLLNVEGAAARAVARRGEPRARLPAVRARHPRRHGGHRHDALARRAPHRRDAGCRAPRRAAHARPPSSASSSCSADWPRWPWPGHRSASARRRPSAPPSRRRW